MSLAKNYLPSSCLYWSKTSRTVLVALSTHLLKKLSLAEVVYGPASASSLSCMYYVIVCTAGWSQTVKIGDHIFLWVWWSVNTFLMPWIVLLVCLDGYSVVEAL